MRPHQIPEWRTRDEQVIEPGATPPPVRQEKIESYAAARTRSYESGKQRHPRDRDRRDGRRNNATVRTVIRQQHEARDDVNGAAGPSNTKISPSSAKTPRKRATGCFPAVLTTSRMKPTIIRHCMRHFLRGTDIRNSINYRDDEHRGLSLPGSENGANRWLTPPTFVPFPRDWWRNILG